MSIITQTKLQVSVNIVPDVDAPSELDTHNVMQWGQFVDHDMTHTPLFRQNIVILQFHGLLLVVSCVITASDWLMMSHDTVSDSGSLIRTPRVSSAAKRTVPPQSVNLSSTPSASPSRFLTTIPSSQNTISAA